jgi:2-polyprenyl-3-methyl-5-hydroxy-6-metoxy-1,4-benzoquinol methylase
MKKGIGKLIKLYLHTGKHSTYQGVPAELEKYIDLNNVNVKPHYDYERLTFILEFINPLNKKIMDVGGNTGLFSFELLRAGAESICLYEGNKVYAEFVKTASNLLGFNNRLKIINKYLTFTDELDSKRFDIILLLNVLHHIGDDYGDRSLSIVNAKIEILRSLNYLADKTKYLIFQLGFCWKGNRNLLLFKKGTKKEMINFIVDGTNEKWLVEHIGIPEEVNGQIEYKKPTDINMERIDRLGEFLNRPIFLMKSKDF